jgi:hypothetical protein
VSGPFNVTLVLTGVRNDADVNACTIFVKAWKLTIGDIDRHKSVVDIILERDIVPVQLELPPVTRGNMAELKSTFEPFKNALKNVQSAKPLNNSMTSQLKFRVELLFPDRPPTPIPERKVYPPGKKGRDKRNKDNRKRNGGHGARDAYHSK